MINSERKQSQNNSFYLHMSATNTKHPRPKRHAAVNSNCSLPLRDESRRSQGQYRRTRLTTAALSNSQMFGVQSIPGSRATVHIGPQGSKSQTTESKRRRKIKRRNEWNCSKYVMPGQRLEARSAGLPPPPFRKRKQKTALNKRGEGEHARSAFVTVIYCG